MEVGSAFITIVFNGSEWMPIATVRQPLRVFIHKQFPHLSCFAQAVGYDGGKKIQGRKRFTLVDTLGLLIAVRVVAASVAEREGA